MNEAKKAGVKHVIYSKLANVKEATNGELNVPHFTQKAEAFDYLQTLGFESVTAIEPAAYYSNWFKIMKPAEQGDGSLLWTWTGKGKPFSHFDAQTGTGPSVLEAAKNPTKYNGKCILLQAETLSGDEVMSLLSQKLGKPCRIQYLKELEYSKLFPGAEELANMVRWFDDYGYYGPETNTRQHNSGKEIGGLLSFQEWLDSGAYEQYL